MVTFNMRDWCLVDSMSAFQAEGESSNLLSRSICIIEYFISLTIMSIISKVGLTAVMKTESRGGELFGIIFSWVVELPLKDM